MFHQSILQAFEHEIDQGLSDELDQHDHSFQGLIHRIDQLTQVSSRQIEVTEKNETQQRIEVVDTEQTINLESTLNQISVSQTICNHELDLQSWFDRGQLLDQSDAIAVKLSVLRDLNLSLDYILAIHSGKVLIDAEQHRLDTWLLDELASSRISYQQLARLIITVQVRRTDARNQVENLQVLVSHGLKILLVAGHQSYLGSTSTIKKNTLIQQFVDLWEYQGVTMLGISSKMVRTLREQGLNLISSEVLELQGYQQLQGSSLWSYFADEHLSATAKQYLSRRQGGNRNYITQSVNEVATLERNHHLYGFIDSCCRTHYLIRLLSLNLGISS